MPGIPEIEDRGLTGNLQSGQHKDRLEMSPEEILQRSREATFEREAFRTDVQRALEPALPPAQNPEAKLPPPPLPTGEAVLPQRGQEYIELNESQVKVHLNNIIDGAGKNESLSQEGETIARAAHQER